MGPAQRWFFRQDFLNPNHWNQSLLFESSIGLNAGVLAAALDKLLQLHPMLETRYFKRDGVWHAEHVRNAGAGCLTYSALLVPGSPGADDEMTSVAERMHQSVDIERGKVFKVHLLKRESQRDCVLFIAHHLCVDAVSWRILLEDLAHLYSAEIEGGNIGMPPAKRSYWDWVQHLTVHRNRLFQRARIGIAR